MHTFSAADGAEAPAQRQFHILVVEDELLIRMMVSDAFRDGGFVVIEAFNGDEAIDIFLAGKEVDLVFSDVRMPGSVDGLALLRFVRARFPDLPFILTSAHLDPGAALEAGATCFLDKPCSIETAVDLVGRERAKAP